MREPNMRVASHTIPMYEYRERSWWEQWLYNRRMERHTTKLLYDDYTIPIIVVLSLVIIAAAIVAGLLLVR